jgi:hypothetical protein
LAESIVTGAAAPPVDAAFQQADALQVQDVFEYKFPFSVQLGSRQSALLPFVQKKMNVERLSIFNARSDRGNPRLGARLENTTDVPFEPGPVTFFESGRYAGEAVLPHISRGDKQLVSYGIDQDVVVSSKQQRQPETTTRLTINKGVAVLFRETVLMHTYEVRNKGSEKTLIVEHARQTDRKLTGVSPWETTDSFYRFRMPLPAGDSTQLPVSEILETRTQVSLQTLNRDQLVMFSGRETPPVIRERLGQIVDLQDQIGGLNAEIAETHGRVETLFQDQERLRENLKALGGRRDEEELRRRYLGQLAKQEDEIARLRASEAKGSQQLNAAQNQLSELIATLSWTAEP